MTKRNVPRVAFLMVATMALSMLFTGFTNQTIKPDSNFNGVQIGVITYSWRSMPGTPHDIINYCHTTGISSIELMGSVVEEYAGAPKELRRPKNYIEFSQEEKDAFLEKREASVKKISEWRVSSVSADKYIELKKMFDDAGVNIHLVKFSPSRWSDEEIDYAFESAKIMGAEGVSNEIGHEACKRLGPIAEKHGMYAVFHNHGQPRDSTFNFEEYLAYSPANMLNLDVGHYFGATGVHPNPLIEKLHDRIFSLHLKDKTAKEADPSDINAPWGEGDTPLDDILKLVQDNGWDIYCDIELEYLIPEDSDAVTETGKCVKYCKNILL
ncbi:MAG: sugar phosphate isomerase/epimerase [Bacteroidetes bacterium]|nr:sugar phosphate isomerase/epimerase [Bacteroidota bacterium]